MTTKKIPQYGDPELLPKGTIRRPSAERMPFTHSGELKPSGPGPLAEERFLEAPDLAVFPQWVRKRGDEWTTAEFRQLVFAWLAGFFDARDWPAKWDVREVASAVRSGRLPEDRVHLVIGITPKSGDRVETSVAFPPGSRENSPEFARAILRSAEIALDAVFASQP